MFKVHISEQADKDLENIAKFIALDNPYRAITFIQELIDSVTNKLSMFPDSGVGKSNSSYLPYKNYLIFYDIDRNSKIIGITHIFNSAQYSAYESLQKKD